jgi:hypothetical protein
MIHPSATDILKTIDATIEAKIIPSLKDLDGRSAITTVRHLLRLVRVRIEEEGQILTDDIAALRKLLPGVRDYLTTLGTGSEVVTKIDAALAPNAEDRYPSLDRLAEEAGAMREAVYQALKHLQTVRDERKDDAGYRAVRTAIRDYTVWQNEQERKLIAPAFYGQGPRR